MSHVTEIKLEVRDIAALKEASEALGLEFREGQKEHLYYGGRAACVHAIGVPGDQKAYEIGVIADQGKPGTFRLGYDGYGQHGVALTAKAGPGLGKLKQFYAAAVSAKHGARTLGRQGFVMSQEMLASGVLRQRWLKR